MNSLARDLRTAVLGAYLAALIVALGVGSPSLHAQQAPVPDLILHYADFVFYNGKVLTADENFRIAEAVAVRGNKILAVGATAEILPLAGPKSRKIDLRGKTVTPGIIDLHGGPGGKAFTNYWEDYWFPKVKRQGPAIAGSGGGGAPQWKTRDDFLNTVRMAVARAKLGEVIILFGDELDVPRDHDAGMSAKTICANVTLKELDAVSANNPIISPSGVNNMTIWINSAAAELIKPKLPKGVTTPFLKPNNICVHHGGSEGGMRLPGVAAADDIAFWLVPSDDERMLPYYRRMVDAYPAAGITMGKQHMAPPLFNGLRELWRRGELNIRFRMPFPLNPQEAGHETHLDPKEAEKWFQRWMNLTGLGDDMLRLAGFRIPAVGGNVERADAWMIEPKIRPYPDRSGAASPFGRSYAELEDPYKELFRSKTALIQGCRYGWDVSADHTIGDRAYREVINAFEECLKNPVVRRKDQRLTTNHTPMAKALDIAKAAKLGIWSSVSTGHSFGARDIEVGLVWAGEQRVAQWSPLKTFVKSGHHPGLEGTMWRQTGGSAFHWVGKSITRTDDHPKYGVPWNPSESLDRKEALWAGTLWSAQQLAEDKKLGSIEPGKLADMVVIDKDYMTIPPAEIEKINVLMTLLDGRVVYEREGALAGGTPSTR